MSSRVRVTAIGAATTLLGTIASFCTVYALCRMAHAQPQPAILAAILAIGLGRRDRLSTPLEAVLACLRIAFVAAVASGIGLLLHVLPWLGAIVFVAGMFLSVWLRDFGERGRAIGALVALPLVAMLVVPGPTSAAPGGPLVDVALVLSAGVISLAYTTAIQWVARRAGFAPFATGDVAGEKPERAKREGMTPTMRMALQMAVALGAAFVVAFAVFPHHWGWAVLTAFIVCSGARGRGDAVYKAVLRLVGALTGTIAAAALAHLWAPRGVAEAIAIFAVLYVGLALRDANYAYWACSTTLILALLAGGDSGVFNLTLLGTRIEAIVVGALCAVAATWFVYPIRTEAVIRRRLADALLALDELVAHGEHERAEAHAKRVTFERRMHDLESVAPPVRWHRRLFARGRDANHPARWIELAAGLRAHSTALAAPEPLPATHVKSIRRAIGASRRAIADHGNVAVPDAVPVGAALEDVHRLFDAARRNV